MLEEQVTVLEKLASNYELPLPEKPPAVEKIADDPEMFEDEFMFKMVTKGIQDAIRLYVRGLIEGTRNDSLRNTFFELLEDEISVFDKMLRYGKVKGWTDIVPRHSKS